MKIVKTFETSIDIVDIGKLYQPLVPILMEELKNKYEGKCYKSSYILEILEIVHNSEVEISTDHQDCIGLVYVTFNALVEVYTLGNIIPVCKLEIKRQNGEFIGSSDDAGIQIIQTENERILPAFKVGDKFPVQIRDVTYNTGQSKMTVLATLPEIKPDKLVIYKIKEPLNDSDIKRLEKFFVNFIEPLHKWLAGLNAADKKKYDEFVGVTYPYKSSKVSALNKIGQVNFTDIKEITKLSETENKYLCYPPEISRSKSFALVLDKVDNEHQSKVFEERLMTILTDYLTSYYNYISILKTFTENYPSPLTERYKALWGLIHLKKEN